MCWKTIGATRDNMQQWQASKGSQRQTPSQVCRRPDSPLVEWRAWGGFAKADDIRATRISEHVVDLRCCICKQLCSKRLLTLQNKVLYLYLVRKTQNQ